MIKPKMWICYVDNTFFIKNVSCKISEVLSTTSLKTKFVLENKLSIQLQFLAVLITRINAEKLQTRARRKPMHKDRLFNYNNSATHKINRL